MGIRSFITRHPVAIGLTTAAGVALAIFVLVWFQPQKLFIDQRVSEALPMVPAAAPSTPTEAGEFRSLAHPTRGTAKIVTLADGSSIVRLENFETDNGPDLFVVLSEHDGTGDDDDAIADAGISLGRLKGNIGDQNYEIPAGTDLSKFNSVLIWCKRFNTGFGVASLTR